MINTKTFAMKEETELGFEQLEAVSGGEGGASAGDIYEALKNKAPGPVREAAEAIEDVGKDIEYMKKNPSYFFLVIKTLF